MKVIVSQYSTVWLVRLVVITKRKICTLFFSLISVSPQRVEKSDMIKRSVVSLKGGYHVLPDKGVYLPNKDAVLNYKR